MAILVSEDLRREFERIERLVDKYQAGEEIWWEGANLHRLWAELQERGLISYEMSFRITQALNQVKWNKVSIRKGENNSVEVRYIVRN